MSSNNEIAYKQHKRSPRHTTRQPPVSDARNHYPRIKHHTPPPKQGSNQNPQPPAPPEPTDAPDVESRHPSPTGEARGPVASGPNSVSGNLSRRPDFPSDRTCLLCTRPASTTEVEPSSRIAQNPNSHTMRAGLDLVVLLRKEVIQPHLPVRLPCYDFVPIADPTFDGSLPQGVRPPASGVTDFHDVTGGVYKARERIHRSVADLRLLATPTSRGRVADPDPN